MVDSTPSSQQREPQEAAGYLDGVNVDRLRKALTKMGCISGAGEEDAASRLAELVNRLTLSVERCAFSAPQEAAEGECRSCFMGKCVTGRECVTLGLDDEGHRATMNLKEIQALFASVDWMTSNPKAAEKIRSELAATLYEIERSAPQEAGKAEPTIEVAVRLNRPSKEAGKVEAVADEPFAYYVYIPAEQRGELVHDLDDATDDLTNCECEVSKLYLRPSQQALSDDTKRLDHLQRTGSTVELVPVIGRASAEPWRFRVGGRYAATHADLRTAIDSAILVAAGGSEK